MASVRPVLLLLLCALPVTAQDPIGRELLPAGTFEVDANQDGWPDGFNGDRNTTKLLEENGNHFVRVDVPPGKPASGGVGTSIKLEPGWFKLRVSVRVRLQDVQLGVEGWNDARVAMDFHSADGTQVGGWPNVMHWTGSTDGWLEQQRDYRIPENAVSLNISASMFNTTGQVDFDDLSVKVVSLRPKPEDARLPDGVVADWSADHAWRQETATRGKLCLNGLWRFYPLMPGQETKERPADGTGWGYVKVPALWPGRGVDSTRPIGPAIWDLNVDWTKVDEGWYERTVTVPDGWTGRRLVTFDLPQTAAEVFVGGQPAGSVRWPTGEVEVTGLIAPGETAPLTVHLTTQPFQAERLEAMREDLIERVKSAVRYRGLAGDVYLERRPDGAHLNGIQTRPSTRDKALGLAVGLEGLDAARQYRLDAEATKVGAPEPEWRGTGKPFAAGDLRDGLRLESLPWADPALWDFAQPNLYDLKVRLVDAGSGAIIDEDQVRFGFRELWLDGRNLMLNGTPVHLRAVTLDAMGHDDGAASKEAVQETIRRMRSLGFNFCIAHNYGFDPGGTTGLTDILDALDEAGLAFSISLPHAFRTVGDVGRNLDDDWRTAARYVVDLAANHPSVLTYAGDHNTLGYYGDQNPLKIDGSYEYRPPEAQGEGALKSWNDRRARAMAAEQFVRDRDPTREVYHHQSGNCGAWHTVNIYLNWSPVQERSEWLQHWATAGVKPLFFVEWGLPHIASWGGHRQGPFIWRNNVNSEPLGVEYGAMLTGAHAYQLTPTIEQYVDNYERIYARKQPFHISSVFWRFWDADNELDNVELQTFYTNVVWPRLRTWGITALLPWDESRVAYPTGNRPSSFDVAEPTPWTELQTPGYHPDTRSTAYDWFGSGWDQWQLTSLGECFQRWNQPVIAFLGGEPSDFTERGHNVKAGEELTKQVVLVNDSRAAVDATFSWRLALGRAPVQEGSGGIRADAGGRAMAPFRFTIPPEPRGEGLQLSLRVTWGDETQTDSLDLQVVTPTTEQVNNLAVFDPAGKTAAELTRLGVTFSDVRADQPLETYSALLVGREAVTAGGRLPDIAPLLQRGGRVLVMEQTEEALTKRLGFRVNDPSLRRVFVRVPNHPVLGGLDDARLADWRGDATLLPDHLELPEYEAGDPQHDWLGFANTRVWKCGNTGQAASIVIEKPQRGDFEALVDGGFDLQYAPLLLHRTGRGQVLYCQMDVSGRTAPDPAADRLLGNLLGWVTSPPEPDEVLVARYVGGDDGAKLLTSLGVRYQQVAADRAAGTGLLIVGPGADLAAVKAPLAEAVSQGATVVALSQKAAELATWLPFEPVTTEAKPIGFAPPQDPFFAGIGPSETHWRGRQDVVLVGGPGVEPDVVSRVPHGKGAYVFCQILPDDWDYGDEYRVYLKRTHNRTAVLLSRILADAGASFEVPSTVAWHEPVEPPVDLSGTWQLAADRDGSHTVTRLDGLTWHELQAPGTVEGQIPALVNYDGVVWYRRSFTWHGSDRKVELRLGAVDDEDWTYLNGQLVGHLGQDTNPDDYWSHPRRYAIPAGLLKEGENHLVVKVRDLRQTMGLVRGPLEVTRPERWLDSFYLDTPAQLDDPYRYNRW